MLEELAVEELGRSLLLIVSYGLLGGGMKYADQAFDEGVFSKRLAMFMAVPGGLLMGALMVWNGASATIFLSIILAVAIARKIDNIAFQLGAGLLFLVPLFFRGIFTIHWLPLGLLVFAGVADELGNDWADRRKLKRAFVETNGGFVGSVSVLARTVEEFFEHRFILKIMLLTLAVFNVFPVIYFIAFLAFDAAYIIVEKISMADRRYRLTAAGLQPTPQTLKQLKTSLQ